MRALVMFRFLRIALLGLIVWAQAGTLAHAAEHGFEEHDHDGIVCALDALAIHQDQILPPEPVQLDLPPQTTFLPLALPETPAWNWPLQRAPPARAPPCMDR
ncbi:MAG: hypothetical protein MRY64_02875 [Hyphomonadaceae bacterium]|nr:hypothetical protein [Hyphomonadaceae bacterium]